MNNIVLFMRGPDDGWMRAKFRAEAGINLFHFQERMRQILPERIIPWMAQILQEHGHLVLPRRWMHSESS